MNNCDVPGGANIGWRDMIWMEPLGMVFLDRDRLRAEVTELRAYRDRTEPALQAWCDDMRKFVTETDDAALRAFTQSEIEDWKESGLWRDAKEGAS